MQKQVVKRRIIGSDFLNYCRKRLWQCHGGRAGQDGAGLHPGFVLIFFFPLQFGLPEPLVHSSAPADPTLLINWGP